MDDDEVAYVLCGCESCQGARWDDAEAFLVHLELVIDGPSFSIEIVNNED
jgi:hypothetical protein